MSQISYTQDFTGCAAASCSGWTISGGFSALITATSGTGYTPCSGASAKSNIYSGSTTTTLAATTSLGTSTGALATVNFNYKVVNYSTGSATAAGSVTFQVQSATAAAGPWTNVGASFTNASTATCIAAPTVTYTPTNGTAIFLRITATIVGATPDCWAVIDDISLSQPAGAPCSGTPAPGNTLANSAYPSTAVCGGSTVALTLQNATSGSGVTYDWQSSANIGGPYVSTGVTTSTYSPTVSTPTYYQCVVTCSAGPSSGTSNPVLVNITNCTFDVTLTSATMTSIMPANGGSGTAFPGWQSLISGDDNTSTTVSLAGTTFTYQGAAVTGFQACSNGWMTFNTSNTSVQWTNALGSAAQTRILAPFWDDLVFTGQTYANRDNCLRYQISGTLGSGSAVITIEWAGLERFSIPGPNLNFQVKLYEGSNNIEFIYGNFEGFEGTVTSNYSYSIGYNGSNPAGLTSIDRFALQKALTNFFSATSDPANLAAMPACNSKFVFTPGTYSGPVSAPADPVPANDDSGSATTLTVNGSPCIAFCGTYYTSLAATNSGAGQACATSSGNEDDDVWFSFTTGAETDYTIRLRSSPGYNGVLQLLDGSLASISCVNATGLGLIETINATGLTPSTLYYVRVFHDGAGAGSSGGQFSICINSVISPPSNDNICGATSLTTGLSCTPTNSPQPNILVATASPQAACGGTPTADVWYSFVAATSNDLVTVQSGSGYNAHMQVYSSSDNTCTGTLTSLACVNNTSTGGAETYSGPFTPGNTYFVRVYHSPGGAATGNFTICVTGSAPACATNPSPADASSVCEGANVILSWTAVTGASSYDVTFDMAGPTNQAGTTYDTGTPASGAHTWSVVPMNALGSATGCPTWNFTVDPAPVAGTASGPAALNAAQSGSYSETGGSGGALQWKSATVSGGPYTNISGATTNPANISFAGPGTYYVVLVRSANGCADVISTEVTTVVTLVGDNVCDAVPLSEGYNGPYSNAFATVESGEAQAPNTDCATQSSWCPGSSGLISNTLWFTFVAPPSGKVRLNYSPSNWDSQIALWSAASCGDLLTGAGTLIAANDDSLSSPFNAWIAPLCLTPGQTYYVQVDGYGSGTNASLGLTLTVEPQTEICNGDIDDDCNGLADDADPGVTGQGSYYTDLDGDGFGIGSVILACIQPASTTTTAGDCNDSDIAINPGATELPADGTDQDCNGTELCFTDNDDDGYRPGDGSSTVSSADLDCTDAFEATGSDPTGDCDDSNGAVNPGATEICNSNVDDDCNTLADDADPGVTGQGTYYADTDGDGYGSATVVLACLQGSNAATNDDCNDSDMNVNPGATEICNGNIDDDCDGLADDADPGVTGQGTYYTDLDGDGFGVGSAILACIQPVNTATALGDCDDNDMAFYPGQSRACYTGPMGTLGVGICTAGLEICNGDGSIGACIGEVLPATEICANTLDDDCDAMVDEISGPLNGAYSVGTGQCFPTVASAVSALNSLGISGPVTFNVIAGHTETSPAGGFTILGTGTMANPVIFQKSGVGPNPTFTAPTTHTVGNLNDAIFKIVGADYITLDGFTMLENAANTTTTAASNNMTEWGVALLYATTTNGAQNCTIKNCTIDLNRTYQNTFGIYSNSTHSPTSISVSATATTTAGSNSGLAITGNTITDVNMGIVVVGPTAAADHNDGLTIGGAMSSGNDISNYGTTGTFSGYVNVSGTVNGILVRNTKNFNVSYNVITSSNGGTTSGTLRGIYIVSPSNAVTGTIVNNINNNTISCRSAAATGAILGIFSESTSANATTTLNINNNDFNNFGHTVTASGAITGISNTAPALTTNINGNTFTNISVNTTGSFTFIGNNVTRPANAVCNVNNNSIVTGFSKTGAGGTVTFYNSNSVSPVTASETNMDNNFSNVTLTGATTFSGWQSTDGPTTAPFGPNRTVTGNIFTNITGGTSATTCLSVAFSNSGSTSNNVANNLISNVAGGGAVTGITSSGGSQNFVGNSINTLSSTGATSSVNGITIVGGLVQNVLADTIHTLSATGSGAVNGINSASVTTVTHAGNKIYNLTNTNAGGSVNGVIISGGTTVTLANNLIGDLKAPNLNATNSVNGINVSGSTATTAVFNTVYLNAVSTGANFGSNAISASTLPNLTLQNNIFVNLSTPAGTGVTTAYRRAATTLTTYNAASNNNLFYAGVPDASHLIYTDGISSIPDLPTYQAFVSARDAQSVTENPPFLSTTGSSANFLHIDPTISTLVESGAVNVAPFTLDYDLETRQGNPGYTGTGTAPDIGADEFEAILAACVTAVGGTASGSIAFCNSGTPAISNAGFSTGAGSTYQWMSSTNSGDYPSGGTPVLGQVSPSTLTTGVVTTTTYYWLMVSCATNASTDYSNMITVTINPSAAVISGPSSKCVNDPAVTLNETGGTGTSWLWSTTETTQSINVNPASSTTYTVTVTSPGGCTTTASTTVAVNPNPTNVMASASVGSICVGDMIDLFSAADAPAGTLLTQNFDSGLGSWTVVNTSTGGSNPSLVAWATQNTGYTYTTDVFTGNQGTAFAMANSDAAGSGVSANTTLTSPAFNTVGYSSLSVSFIHYYKHISAAAAFVEVSTNGSSWTTVQSYAATTGTAAAFATATVNLDAYIGLPTVYVRFRHTGGWYYYWAVDDIAINGTPASYTYAWTSDPSGFSSSIQNPTGVMPSGATDYTVVVTGLGGCTSSDVVSVGATPQTTYYGDLDGDGYGNPIDPGTPLCADPGAGYATNNSDCDDGNMNINPGATEICNSGVDDDCNTLADDADPGTTGQPTWYQDFDGDGKGNPDVTTLSCLQPLGYVADSFDCNDNSIITSCTTPTGTAVSGVTDVSAMLSWNASPGAQRYNLQIKLTTDATYGPNIKVYTNSYTPTDLLPGKKYNWRVRAVCDSLCGISSGLLAGPNFTTNYRVYPDTDGDGFGANVPYVLVPSFPLAGYSLNNLDCNDSNNAAFPGASEICNGIDDDCDLTVDEGTTPITWYQDSDGDLLGNALVTQSSCAQPVGYVSNNLDCNDSNPSPVCALPASPMATGITATTATVSWTGSPCISFYGFQYKLSTSSTWINSTTYSTSVGLTGLMPNSTYNFRVRSRCNAPSPALTTAWVTGSFTTLAPLGLVEDDVNGSNNETFDGTFGVYPNPGDGIFNLKLESLSEGDAEITVMDQLGKTAMIYNWPVFEGLNFNQLDLTKLVNGVYQVQIKHGDMMSTKKVVLLR